MKKLILLLFIILGTTANSKAQKNYTYDVVVTVRVTYEFKDGNTTVSTQTGVSETQNIEVCASSPEDARQKAIKQCEGMCRSAQYMGTTIMNNKKVDKYKHREVYDATPKKRTINGEC
ncbi:MAG: hypothetical protein J6S82_01140 [Bacteroidales bacterium]|nr:hypothetical protein [Bacteroidales bacterium]